MYPQQDAPLQLSVIIPCFNEARTICNTIRLVHQYLIPKNVSHEIWVVDDGSTDQTRAEVEKLISQSPWLKLLKLPHQGKGGAVRRGMLESRGLRALFMDADLSTPIEELPAFLEAIQNGAAVVIASREIPGSTLVVPQPPHRRLVGQMFRWMIWLLFGLPFRDTQCGFKLFTREAVNLIFPKQKTNGFVFDIELLYWAKFFSLKTVELPVRWTNRLPSRLSLMGDFHSIIKDLAALRLSLFRARP